MPAAWAANIERLKTDNPGWEHRLYDEAAIERFITDHYGATMMATYRRIDPRYFAARSDLFRYLALNIFGGVYLDVKSGALRPLDDIVEPQDSYVLAKWRNGLGEVDARHGLHRDVSHIPGGEFQQWHIIAAPKHPFLGAVISRVVHNIDNHRAWLAGTGGIGVLRTTGPIPYTLAIDKILDRHPHRIAGYNDDLALVYNMTGQLSRERSAHYTKLDMPIVAQGWLGNLCFNLAQAILPHLRAIETRLRGKTR